MGFSRSILVTGTVAALIALTACEPLAHRRIESTDTESVAITIITVQAGTGDIVVRAGTGPGVRIKRVMRYRGAEPTTSYRIEGTELFLDTDCGRQCAVSFEVQAPKGVQVRGEVGSSDVELSAVGPVDLRLGSGDVTISAATGEVRTEAASGNIRINKSDGVVRAETKSGNIEVHDVSGAVTLRTGSGNITGRSLDDTVDAEVRSGNVELELSRPASVRAHSSSGSVRLSVPAGAYRVRANADSGNVSLGVTDDPAATVLLDLQSSSGNITLAQR